MHTPSRRRTVVTFTFACLVGAAILGCPGQQAGPVVQHPIAAGQTGTLKWHLSKSGLGFRVSDADDDGQGAPTKIAPTTPMTDAETNALLGRLPEMKGKTDDVKPFALRDKSPPPPRTGKTVTDTFPPPLPPVQAPTVAQGPLKVLRHAPDGKVAVAPFLTVTFNAPLVAITSLDELAKTPPPVALSPLPRGEWQWLGTQTVMFKPEKRFPMSTDYSVDIPAGTKGANGNVLASAEHFAFSTPTVTLTSSYPNSGPQKLDPILFAQFDQAIDAAAVLRLIDIVAGPTHLHAKDVEDGAIDEDPYVASLKERAEKGRFVIFRAEHPLPAGTGIAVTFPKGLPSAEGPKTTTGDQSFAFSTYSALRIEHHGCNWSDECKPMTPLSIEFNNGIDRAKFEKAMVKIEPELPGAKIEAAGQWITITGKTKGRTKYKVTLSASTPDIFGQTLGHDESVTMDIGSADPRLFSEDREMSVLDPALGAKLPIFSVNDPTLNVRVYQVKIEDWDAYQKFRQAWDYDRKMTTPPGKLVVQKTIKTKVAPDDLTETPIDLTAAMKEGFGQAIVIVETTRPARDKWYKEWVRAWVQVTHLGIDVMADTDTVVPWITALDTGTPIAGVEVGTSTSTGKTDANGLATLTGARGASLWARRGPDAAFIPSIGGTYGGGTSLHWLIFDDRHMYKPGEEAHVKGWARRVDEGKNGDTTLDPNFAGTQLTWKANDARGSKIGEGTFTPNAIGGFDFVIPIPKNANLGHAYVSIEGAGNPGSYGFEVQEFRRPEFEVNAKTTEGPNFVGGNAIATVEAKYFAGGGLPNADVTWSIRRTEAHFTPPNRSEYVFGRNEWLGWWWRNNMMADGPGAKKRTSETWTGKTNPSGAHRIRLDFDALDPAFPMGLELDAAVTDVNRQMWSAHASVLVHPADVYVGIRAEKSFVNAGEPFIIESIVTDLDGKAVAGRAVTIRSARLDLEQKGEEYEEKEVDPDACSIVSGDVSQKCSLKTKEGGRYHIVAIVEDENGRKSESTFTAWVTGGTPSDRELKQGVVEIVPDKKSYAAGDTAELLLVAPFAPAEGLLAIERAGIMSTQRFTMTSRMQTVKIKLEAKWEPGAQVSVFVVGATPREDENGEADARLPKKPAMASGEASLVIPPVDRTLTLALTPRDKAVEPGGNTVVAIDTKDARGAAVKDAEVAVVVVDEAILALTGYKLPDPIAVFYPDRGSLVTGSRLRDNVFVAPESDVANGLRALGTGPGGGGQGFGNGHGRLGGNFEPMPAASAAMPPPSAPMKALAQPIKTPVARSKDELGADSAPSDPSTPIALRTDFSALALFAPHVLTDARGHAEVSVKLPDNLTRYRVMAIVAARENEFGSSESAITARLPLMVRPSAPRFLNFGDRFELPVVLQNQTDVPMNVSVAARSLNATIDNVGKKVTVPANDRVEVRFLASAAQAGTARFQLGASSGRFSDASQIEMPVWTPATTEAFATYGVIDQGSISQPVKMPGNVIGDYGGLEITTSSTALSALTDAVLYLHRYPYECNEQLASRVLSIAALRDVLTAFSADGLPPPAELNAGVEHDLDRLRTRQRPEGGWGFWFTEEWPYLSVHVTHALQRAKEKGYKVDDNMLARAHQHVTQIESYIPSWYGIEERRAIIAYALYVRDRMGDRDVARAKRLVREEGGINKMGLEMVGWLMPIFSKDPGSKEEIAQIRVLLQNRATETAGAAHFTTSYTDGEYLLLHSDRRADGILLESMIGDDPKSDLLPKIVTGLLAHRKAGHWASTQENAFVLLGLDRYFQAFEKVSPDFVARAWLGQDYAGEHAYKGHTTERQYVEIPMKLLATSTDPTLVLQKDGAAGRLYYRIGMQYAPADLKLPPTDHGFVVSRLYEGVDSPDDVKKTPDGTWHVKSGVKVRIRVSMVAQARRYHVALVDPFPAGFEPMNPELAVTGPIPPDPKAQTSPYWWWGRSWYEHQNMRDERAEAFASLLWEGVYEYSYVARATTPGTFVVPPPKAEEMYSPEVFGRGSGDKVIVE